MDRPPQRVGSLIRCRGCRRRVTGTDRPFAANETRLDPAFESTGSAVDLLRLFLGGGVTAHSSVLARDAVVLKLQRSLPSKLKVQMLTESPERLTIAKGLLANRPILRAGEP